MDDETRVRLLYCQFIQTLKNSSSSESIEEFCWMLYRNIADMEEQERKPFLVRFWTEVERKTLNSSDAIGLMIPSFRQRLQYHYLCSMVQHMADKSKTAKSFEFLRKRQSIENPDDCDEGHLCFRKFVACLHREYSDTEVESFCAKIEEAVCALELRSAKVRAFLFWAHVLDLIRENYSTHFKEILMIEIDKILDEDFAKLEWFPCITEFSEQLHTVENKERLLLLLHTNLEKKKTPYGKIYQLLKENYDNNLVEELFLKLNEEIRQFEDFQGLKERLQAFWRIVSSFPKNRSSDGNFILENILLRNMVDLTDIIFDKSDLLNLVSLILKTIRETKAQFCLAEIFHEKFFDEKPVRIESFKRPYYIFIQRLKLSHPNDQESVRQFCNNLHLFVTNEKNSRTIATQLEKYWIVIENHIKDGDRKLDWYDSRQKLLPEINKRLIESSNGNNCLAEFSSYHQCCDCGCIDRATKLHKCYYRCIYGRSKYWRSNCTGIAYAQLCARNCVLA